MKHRLVMLMFCMLSSMILHATELNNIYSGISGVVLSSLAFGDYDNDGDMDLCISGLTNQGNVTKVYNNVDGEFILTDIALPGISSSSISWVDFDNDGDLDLFIAGRVDNQQIVARLYRNNNGNFTDTNFDFIPVTNASCDWGDIDNDGRIDLIISGSINDTQCVTKLFINSPEGFVESDIPLPAVHSGSVKFGDFDNDGWLDLFITGISQEGPRISKIFRNDQAAFSDINANLLAVGNSSVCWGDFNNDGWLDIALSGRTNANEIGTRVYQNNAGKFVDINAPIEGVYLSSMVWADIDNNGYLDLIISGGQTLTSPFNPYSAVYYNSDGVFTDSQQLTGVCFSAIGICDFDNDNDLDILLTGRTAGGMGASLLYSNTGTPPNIRPSAPNNLRIHEDENYYYFGWDEAMDTLQASISLSYSIMIGSSSGACDIVSPASLSTGVGLLPNLGNIHSMTVYAIRKEVFQQDITYYWSCQAIDNSFSRSFFAQESSFSATSIDDDLIDCDRQFVSVSPNPFNPTATIEYSILQTGPVNLSVFNIRGQRVKTLINGYHERGMHRMVWNGRDEYNRGVASGLYFIRLEAAGKTSVRKAMLLK